MAPLAWNIQIWVTVKPCKKISMGIFFQDTVTLSGKLLIVYAIVTLQHPVLSISEIILVRNPIRRVSKYHGHGFVRHLPQKLHAVHTVNMVLQFYPFIRALFLLPFSIPAWVIILKILYGMEQPFVIYPSLHPPCFLRGGRLLIYHHIRAVPHITQGIDTV